MTERTDEELEAAIDKRLASERDSLHMKMADALLLATQRIAELENEASRLRARMKRARRLLSPQHRPSDE